jgi:hypothetical protein
MACPAGKVPETAEGGKMRRGIARRPHPAAALQAATGDRAH